MRKLWLVLFLAALSMLSGYMFSKVTWVGKIGMSFFYAQYNFLKVWWKGALLMFGVLIVLLLIQAWVQSARSRRTAVAVHITAVFLALAGLLVTYNDFRNTMTHRWLGERFHIGGYLFWIGWMVISFFLLSQLRRKEIKDTGNKDEAGL